MLITAPIERDRLKIVREVKIQLYYVYTPTLALL